MNRKLTKVIAGLLASTMLFAACSKPSEPAANEGSGNNTTTEAASGGSGETVSLKVWGSQEDQEMLQGMIDAFKAQNSGKTYDISLGVVGEPDAVAKYLEDPVAAADIFAFPNDQLYDLVRAGGLYEVTRNVDALTQANGSSAMEAASANGKVYGYPMTADNGYFLYYDKNVFSEDDVKSLDKMMEVAQAAGKQVFFDLSNGWYIASFFLGAGGKLSLDDNGNQVCDFNNETGVKVGEYIKNFAAHPAFATGDDDFLKGNMGTKLAAAVSGTWNAEAFAEKLGDGFAATKLPTINLDGKETQLGSFVGYKIVGVSSQTKYPVDAMDLAEWLTNEENQLTRFKVRLAGPSNLNVAASDDVKANIPLAALAMQSQYGTSQKDVLSGYWGPSEAFGNTMETKDYSKSVKELLDAMVEQITVPVN